MTAAWPAQRATPSGGPTAAAAIEPTIEPTAEPARTFVRFIRSLGLAVELGPLPAPALLPGVAIAAGRLHVDEARLAHSGDLLHEAGHLAVMPPHERATGAPSDSPGAEMAAIAWSWAAAQHLGVDAAIVFHPAGYRGGSQSILDAFASGRGFGVPLLAWYGMTREQPREGPHDPGAFPAMRRWLRP